MDEAHLPHTPPERDETSIDTDSPPGFPDHATPFVLPKPTWAGRIASFFVMLFVLLILVAGLAVSGMIPHSWFFGEPEKGTTTLADALPVSMVKGEPRTLLVPKEVRKALGMRKGGKELVAVAQPPSTGTPLVLSGSTALDPTRLLRLRARFAPAEVVTVGQTRDTNDRDSVVSQFRELRSGDRVAKGTVLGEFFSVDVGSKKSDLYDALVQLALDEEILAMLETPEARGSVPPIFILNAKKAVVYDRSAINKAEKTLLSWSLPPEDIEAIHEEADKAKLDSVKSARKKKDKDKDKDKETAKERKAEEKKAKEEQLKRWARVELKAPYDATIIERNVAQHEVVVDGTTNLFILARVDQIAVIANAPEDDLPTLQGLTFSQRHWTVRTVGIPPKGVEGPIDEIGYIIDPTQHTAVIKGHIPNPGGRLRGGVFASLTIALPPPPDTVEIPMDAIVDDGKQCVVFVQADPTKENYTMRRVLLTHRFEKTAFVRSVLKPEDKLLKPGEQELGVLVPEPLVKGDRVILSGVLELKKELEDKEGESASGDKVTR
jgi:membrane fusion protein, heavy metal efflux system